MNKFFSVLTAMLICISVSAQIEIKVKPKAFTKGCGNFMVFKYVDIKKDLNTLIVINVDQDKLQLSNKLHSFKIGKESKISGALEFTNKVRSNYCTDALDPEQNTYKTIPLVSGNIKIKIKKDEGYNSKMPGEMKSYKVDVILENALFKKGTTSYSIKKIEFKDVRVNYMM